jgi:hypothetical protein
MRAQSERAKNQMRFPKQISADIWFYEEPTKIEFYISADLVRGTGANECIRFSVSRRKIRAALKRMDAAVKGKP